MALGELLGTLAGAGVSAATGGAVPPNVSIPMLAGLGGNIEGMAQRRKANSQFPDANDFQQVQLLEQLKRRQRAIETGTDTMSQYGKSMIEQEAAANRQAITQTTGGNVASTIAALARLNRGTGRNISELTAGATGRQMQMDNSIANLINLMSQRRLGLQRDRYYQTLAEAEQSKRSGMQNLMGGLANMDYNNIAQLLANRNQQSAGTPYVTPEGSPTYTPTVANDLYNKKYNNTVPYQDESMLSTGINY
jgi:hypothetical protein